MALLKLSREDLVEVDKLYKGGALDKPEPVRKPQNKATVSVRNSTNAAFKTGEPILVSGFASLLTFAQAKKRMVDGTLVMGGYSPTSGAGLGQNIGTCASPIPPGKIGDVEMDVAFSVVTFSDTTHNYATNDRKSAFAGDLEIAARSGYLLQNNISYAVCALVPKKEDIRLARINSAWSIRAGERVYSATANFIVNDQVDASYSFLVYAPLATSAPTGSSRLWVIWRGRWESLQTLFSFPRYKGGDAMSIYREPMGEDYVVDNRGLTRVVVINGQGTETSSRLIGPLYLDDAFFQLVNLGAGAKGVSLKLSQKTVVTGITQDSQTGVVTATTARIPILGYFD